MDGFKRFGLYVVPEGALYRAGAEWLGWDSVAGCAVAQPALPGLTDEVAAITATPRKYGFHGTIKPPFRLADGTDPARLAAGGEQLDGAVTRICTGLRDGPFVFNLGHGISLETPPDNVTRVIDTIKKTTA